MNRDACVGLHQAAQVVQASMRSRYHHEADSSMLASEGRGRSSSSSSSSSTSSSTSSSSSKASSPLTSSSPQAIQGKLSGGGGASEATKIGITRNLVRKRSFVAIPEGIPEYLINNGTAATTADNKTTATIVTTSSSCAADPIFGVHKQSPDSTSQEAAAACLHPHEVEEECGCSGEVVLQQRNRRVLFARLEEAAPKGKLSLINLARHGIGVAEARLLREAIAINPHLSVLKLAYNCLGDEGAVVIADALSCQNGKHHPNLSVLDLGFNGIGDVGCEAVALQVVAGNYNLCTLYLTGNQIREKGGLSIAGAILHGTGVSKLFLAANEIGSTGLKAIAGAIVESDAQVALNGARHAARIGGESARFMEELDLGSTSFDSTGFIAIPGMLLSNSSLTSLCLANNNIDDSDMMLLSQALTQNKNVPLRSLRLSFNQITCQGVECLMNAIWGSSTLRELYCDNNRIQDRGAQLCAVVLTSIALETLDLAFNRVTTLGLKALMKNISENTSLRTLGLCGIPIDLNGSKAVSYALAYNSSLKAVYVDNSSTGYSSQRHIVAGIVSNRRSSLRVLTGFQIGAVARTLGMPNIPEQWSNDQVLGFFRLMWQQWLLKSGRGVTPSQDDEATRGPAPPAAVAAAAKITLTALGSSSLGKLFHTEAHERPVIEGPPVEPSGSAFLERTDSGTMRVPSFPDGLDVDIDDLPDIRAKESDLTPGSSGVSTVRGPLENPERRNRNLQWLRQHFRSLSEVGRLPFNNADLWKLHQYYFSPPFPANADVSPPGDGGATDAPAQRLSSECSSVPPPTPAFGTKSSDLGRAVSFQTLGDAFAASGLIPACHKRRSLNEYIGLDEPAMKRAKSLSEPRIAYYPRVMVKIQSLGTKPMEQSLSLLRQLKYTENIIFAGRDPYGEDAAGPDDLSHADVEMILLDLL